MTYQYGHWTSPYIISDTTFGFVYCITNTLTQKKYIGCKQIKVKKKRNDWQSYTGSSKQLNADISKHGKQHFTYSILSIHNNKQELKLSEALEILQRNALQSSEYYNIWIMLRFSNNKKR